MNRIARNVTANAFGGVWLVALNLLAIPVQIRILGTEAYGLIGFIATMQLILVVFDLGLPSTIIREVALDKDDKREFSRRLVQTCSTLYWLVALVTSVLLILAADWIAIRWLHVENMPVGDVAQALRLLAVYILFLWPVNIYVSTMAGLQRFDIINLLRIINATSVQLGGIVILLLTHNLYAFIGWLVLNAIAFLLIYMRICFRLLPGLSLRPRLSGEVIKRVWKFSFDLNLISTLAVIYTQADHLIISAVLPLRLLGYYNAAYNISNQIGSAQNFINSPMMPVLSEKSATNDKKVLNDFYVRYAQLLVYVIALPALVLIFFSNDILKLLAGPEIARGGSVAMSLLAFGYFLNAAMSSNYTLSIASGHTRIAVFVNVGALLIYIPGLFYLVTTYGITGAALGWVILHIYYLLVFVPFTQHRILGSTAIAWLRHIFLPFSLLGIMIFGIGWWVQQSFTFEWAWLVNCIGCAVVYTIVGYFLLAPSIRQQFTAMSLRILSRRFT